MKTYIIEMTDTRSILRYYIRSSLYSTYTYIYDIRGNITTLYFKNSYVLYLLFFTVGGVYARLLAKPVLSIIYILLAWPVSLFVKAEKRVGNDLLRLNAPWVMQPQRLFE